MLGARVPVAAVYEHSHAGAREHHVRPDARGAHLERHPDAVPQAQPVQRGPQPTFWPGVGLAVRAHDSGNGVGPGFGIGERHKAMLDAGQPWPSDMLG